MKKNLPILLLFFFVLSSAVYAQDNTITGKVVAADGSPLAGATVSIRGSNKATITDETGHFKITVAPNVRVRAVIISLVGYEPKELPVQNLKQDQNIVLSTVASTLEAVQIVGSRNTKRTKTESPVPVDIIDFKPLLQSAPQSNVTELLQYVAPSFHTVPSDGGDAAAAKASVQLRGLGVDELLVLVNGKRRHKSSNVQWGGLGSGTTGYDLNAIPVGAIERIEILRDGAAAQYGSDAIAGVINVVLKKSINELTVNSTASVRKRGDGLITRTSANYGFGLGKNGGYFNVTAEFATRGISLPGSKKGEGLYTGPIYGGGANTRNYDAIYTKEIDEAILASRGIDRHFFDQRGSSIKSTDALLSFNASVPLSANTELYAFGGISHRFAPFTAVYRLPGWTARNNNFIYPDGFLPVMENTIVDQSLAVGVKSKVNNWTVDISNVYGKNAYDNVISNTLNASLGVTSPTVFDAGKYNGVQNTASIDISRYFDNALHGISVAFGGQYRIESYQIVAGEEGSYSKGDQRQVYGVDTTVSGVPYLNSNGIIALNDLAPGSQIHLGFRPSSEVHVRRAVSAGYVDLEANITKNWLVSGAVRIENFTDFGSVTTYKAATRYSFAKWLNIRGAYNTGFRAPDLSQANYTEVSTTFTRGVGVDLLTPSNNSAAARALNIPKLYPEKSKGYSVGITSQVGKNFDITVDAYYIDVVDRIANTGSFSATDPDLPDAVKTVIQQTGANQVKFFYNEFSTNTKGIEATASYRIPIGNGQLHFIGGANFVKNKVTSVNLPKGLDEKYRDVILSASERVRVTTAVPVDKITLQGIYNIQKFNFLLRTVRFGSTTAATFLGGTDYFFQKYRPIWVTDVSAGYNFTRNIQATIGANNVFDVYGDYPIPQGLVLRNIAPSGGQNGNAGLQLFVRVVAKF